MFYPIKINFKKTLLKTRKAQTFKHITNFKGLEKNVAIGGGYFTDKGPSSQNYGFSSSHVRMWELDY